VEIHSAEQIVGACPLNNLMKLKWFADYFFGKLMGAYKMYALTCLHDVWASGCRVFALAQT
jgi:hypothetical protein